MAKVSSYRDDISDVLRLDLPWEKFNGSNILVTGATGLIGSCLIDVLMSMPSQTYNVYAAGRNKARAEMRFSKYIHRKNFHFLQYDVEKPIHSEICFQYIVHAASNASPNFFAKKPVEVMKSNIQGLINLVEFGLGHSMRRLLYVSSGEVYGEGDGSIFKEEYSGYVNPNKSRSCYPCSKRAAETLCASYIDEYNADIVIARPSHVYGPYFTESDNRVFAQFIRNVINKQDIVMKSTGSQYRSWCYVVDCVSALLYILLKGRKGDVYNVADNRSNLTIKELAELIARIGNRKVVIDLPTNEELKGFNPVTRSVFDTTKLEGLGWSVNGTICNKMISTIRERCEDLGIPISESSQNEEDISNHITKRS